MISIKHKIDSAFKRDSELDGGSAQIYLSKDAVLKDFKDDDAAFCKEVFVYARLGSAYKTLFRDAYIVPKLAKNGHRDVSHGCFLELERGIPCTDFPRTFEPKYFLERIFLKLAELHSVGIIHADIKPDNIVAVGDDVHLIDFSASVLEITTNTNRLLCMATTRAPEHFIENRAYQFDTHSLAKTFCILFPKSLMKRNFLKKEGLSLIQRCMSRNPDKRPTAHEVCSELGIWSPKPESMLYHVHHNSPLSKIESHIDFLTNILSVDRKHVDQFMSGVFDGDDYLCERDRPKCKDEPRFYYVDIDPSAIHIYNRILDFCEHTIL